MVSLYVVVVVLFVLVAVPPVVRLDVLVFLGLHFLVAVPPVVQLDVQAVVLQVELLTLFHVPFSFRRPAGAPALFYDH
jgi:hypothetical protein